MRSKKKILELYYSHFEYRGEEYTYALCYFLQDKGFSQKLQKAFKQYLLYENMLLLPERTTLKTKYFYDGEDMEVSTFRIMVLEDFLTKQGIK